MPPAKRNKEFVLVRNLQSLPLTLRLGSQRQPFHVTLKRRGEPGDIQPLPLALRDHPEIYRSLGTLIEEVTQEEAQRIESTRQSVTDGPDYAARNQSNVPDTALLRNEYPIAKRNRIDSPTIRLSEDEDISRPKVPHRFAEQKAEVREIGPKIVRRPGSDNTNANSKG